MNFEPTRWIEPRADGLPDAAWRWLADRLGMPALLATPARAMRDIQLPATRLPDAAREKFVTLLGADQVRGDAASRIQHSGNDILNGLRRLTGDLTQAPDAVLLPRTEDEAVAAVRVCSELNVTIGGRDGRPSVALDLAHLARLEHDAMSGLVSVEAGIGSAELRRRLEARGLGLDAPDFASLGDAIAENPDAAWLHGVRVATPLGLAADLGGLAAGSGGAFGVVTGASLRVRPLPAAPHHRHYLFADFAAGLAALHQAARGGIAHHDARLSDDAATRFARGLARASQPFDLLARLRDIHREVRHFDDRAAALAISFPDAKARKAFEALVRRLHGMRLHGKIAAPDLRPLPERGVNVERFTLAASWSKLPAVYALARHSLDQAMRIHVPRPGAHGLVLADIAGVRPEGATLLLTAIYPRKLDDALAQAQAIHAAGARALAQPQDGPSQAARAAVKQALDPKNILPPLQA